MIPPKNMLHGIFVRQSGRMRTRLRADMKVRWTLKFGLLVAWITRRSDEAERMVIRYEPVDALYMLHCTARRRGW